MPVCMCLPCNRYVLCKHSLTVWIFMFSYCWFLGTWWSWVTCWLLGTDRCGATRWGWFYIKRICIARCSCRKPTYSYPWRKHFQSFENEVCSATSFSVSITSDKSVGNWGKSCHILKYIIKNMLSSVTICTKSKNYKSCLTNR